MSDFESTLTDTAQIAGWLREDQARVLWQAAAAAGPGARIVEIGSYQGRSTIFLARAMAADAQLIAIDPHAGNDRGPQQWDGDPADGEADNVRFWANLRAAGVSDRVRHIRAPSDQVDLTETGEVDVLYIDGAHRYRNALNDLDRWASRVRAGGTLLIHDTWNSVGVTLAVARRLLLGSTFRYQGRSRSLAFYRREAVQGSGRAQNAWAQLRPVPFFAHNVAIKVLREVGDGRAARLLGYRGDGTY